MRLSPALQNEIARPSSEIAGSWLQSLLGAPDESTLTHFVSCGRATDAVPITTTSAQGHVNLRMAGTPEGRDPIRDAPLLRRSSRLGGSILRCRLQAGTPSESEPPALPPILPLVQRPLPEAPCTALQLEP